MLFINIFCYLCFYLHIFFVNKFKLLLIIILLFVFNELPRTNYFIFSMSDLFFDRLVYFWFLQGVRLRGQSKITFWKHIFKIMFLELVILQAFFYKMPYSGGPLKRTRLYYFWWNNFWKHTKIWIHKPP